VRLSARRTSIGWAGFSNGLFERSGASGIIIERGVSRGMSREEAQREARVQLSRPKETIFYFFTNKCDRGCNAWDLSITTRYEASVHEKLKRSALNLTRKGKNVCSTF
jgi:hypothetical protein